LSILVRFKEAQVALLKIKLKNATVQRDESQDKELEDAIEKISNSNKDGSDTLKTYKKNSVVILSDQLLG
jgi:hypothetical protein